MLLDTALLIILIAISATFIIFQLRGSRSFAPWVPSHTGLLDTMLQKINPQPGQSFIDLGSGDGRAVFLAAQKYRLQATGVELSPPLYLYSSLKRLLSPQKNHIIFQRIDLYKVDLSHYTYIYCYGLPENINDRLQAKIMNEAKPGTWIMSYNFSFTKLRLQDQLQDKWRTIRAYKV